MFEPYGDADKAGADADGGAFFGREFGVGGAGGVGGNATGVAEVSGEGEHFQAVEEFLAGLEAAFQFETDDSAAVVHLFFCDRVLGVAWQEGIAERGDGGVGLELLGDIEGVVGMSFHADVEGLEASAEDPGVEGGEGGAGAAAEQVYLVYEVFFTEDGPAQDAALAVDPFGGGMDDEVGAVLDGCLSYGGSETIVDVKEDLVFAAEFAGGSEVDDIECRVGWGLDIEHFCIGPDGGFPGLWVAGAYVGIIDAIFGQVFGDDSMGAAEYRVTRKEVVALLEEGKEAGHDSAHAGCGGEAVFGAFECGQAVGEFLDGRVAKAAVHVGFFFIGEHGAHIFGIVVAETAGQEEGGGMFFVWCLVGADTDGLCDAVRRHGVIL